MSHGSGSAFGQQVELPAGDQPVKLDHGLDQLRAVYHRAEQVGQRAIAPHLHHRLVVAAVPALPEGRKHLS